MSTEAYSLVEGLLEYCGIDSDGLREDGRVLLTVDSEMAIFIVVQDGLVHLSAVLDELPEQPDLYLRLLTENFRNVSDPQYYRYAVEPDSKSLIICLSLNSTHLQPAKFIDYFKLFLQRIEQWTRVLYLNNADYLTLDLDAGTEPVPAQPPDLQQEQLLNRI